MNALIKIEDLPPVTTKFTLAPQITAEQRAFLKAYGFLHFRGVASMQEIETLRAEQDRLEALWLERGEKQLFGIPFFFGRGMGGRTIIQRIPFTSRFSTAIDAFV